ncbi:DUF397 domain-containing protein [Nocardiopsis xinjiangensis]|uniref:DUF397 domain-containing protein n=1 Tax=Nocardiopsis xinjiangensis TaxID=124285 RepID=UPI00037F7E5C|nr:DUF397 domain-containing protein [Nocardiopsis xinjiangensis]
MTSSTTTDASFVPTGPWHKSSYTNDRGECVEVAEGPVTGVRDTKHRELGVLHFSAAEWRAFLSTAMTDTR